MSEIIYMYLINTSSKGYFFIWKLKINRFRQIIEPELQ